MIVRNSKYQLPFELPEPKGDNKDAKLVYIIEKIYQKISKKNNYAVPKNTRAANRDIAKATKRMKKLLS